jgi:hypothetical protein
MMNPVLLNSRETLVENNKMAADLDDQLPFLLK